MEEQVFIDICDALGCPYDNEAVFAAIDALKTRGEPAAWMTNKGAATTEKRMAEIWRDMYGFIIEPLYK